MKSETIERTVDIPASRKLRFDVPRKVSEGAKPAASHADFLLGICASATDISLEQIREERLVNKYLK
jgi:hypothetical protein